mmetsp:Transcript_45203/g.125358  ORF Transcript_45203/g.125358 Transcript_45203/m.125358 type:complete len:113 (+) Transcript_45203:41-379(+)
MLIIPHKWMLDNEALALQHVGRLVNHVASQLTLNTSAVVSARESNVRFHPTLNEAIDGEMQRWLRTTFFDPDTRALSEILSGATKEGLVVAGNTTGICTTADGCYEHLVGSW